MEARLQIATSGKGLKIRSLAWTGDEVGNRLRLEGYPKHMKNLIKQWPSNVLVLGIWHERGLPWSRGTTSI